MAREKTFEERRRERERESEQNESLRANDPSSRSSASPAQEKFEELILRAGPLIDQVNGLYNQYIAGVESRPPLERRKQLDQVMLTLQAMSKPTSAAQFRYTNLNSSYMAHKDRWDRMMKDLETGKLKRRVGSRAA